MSNIKGELNKNESTTDVKLSSNFTESNGIKITN